MLRNRVRRAVLVVVIAGCGGAVTPPRRGWQAGLASSAP